MRKSGSKCSHIDGVSPSGAVWRLARHLYETIDGTDGPPWGKLGERTHFYRNAILCLSDLEDLWRIVLDSTDEDRVGGGTEVRE